MSFAITALAIAGIGIATSLTLGAISLRNQKKAARAQLDAQAMQAKSAAEQRIKGIRKLAASQRASFLHSGIALTGEGTPDDLLSETYDTGIADVENILQQGQVRGDAIHSQARAKMLSTYGQMASDVSSYASMAVGGMGKLGSAKTVPTSDGLSFDGIGGNAGMGSSFDSFGGGSFSGSLSDPKLKFNTPYAGYGGV